MQQENDTVRLWSQNAPFWEKYRETILGMFAPVTRALIAEARIESGYSVLDVATGPGEPALTVAEVVGSGGRVFAIDPSTEMIAAARRAAARDHKHNVQFEIAFADRLPFRTAEFDAVVSRFGVMFFPSPVDGVREMLRVLKPGHRLVFAVWHFGERNPFHHVLASVMDRYVPPEPLPPDAPEVFRFAAPGKLVNVLNEAGANEVRERILQFRIEAPGSVDDFWTLRSEMSDKLRKKLAALSQEQSAAFRREVIQDLRLYSTEQGVSFPAEVVIVSGIKP